MGKARKLIMKTTFRRRGIVLAAALVLLWAVSAADTGGGSASFVGTGWALLPPAVAIVLAFVTKEVYSSLLAGCVMGALLAEGFAPWRSFETLFLTLMEGIDRKIFFFDVLLGAIVVLFARSGGSRAFGEWASRRVRSRRGAETATAGLGCLIFLDDYFNCLTVGAIMQPIADRFRISRRSWPFSLTPPPPRCASSRPSAPGPPPCRRTFRRNTPERSTASPCFCGLSRIISTPF